MDAIHRHGNHLEVVIEECERPIGRERRQPQRQPGELDGHRVHVDAVQTPLRHPSPQQRALVFTEIRRLIAASSNQRRFVRIRQIPARGDEKRAAPHCRIDDAKLEDFVGGRLVNQGTQSPADQVVRDGLRRVERAGGLSNAGSTGQGDDGAPATGSTLLAWHARFVVEQCLVHRSELFDPQVPVSNPFPAGAAGQRPRSQSQQRAPCGLVIQISALGEGRPRGGEQAAVEWGDLEVANLAAGVSEMSGGAQRFPQPGYARRALYGRTERLQAVAVSIDRMPEWNQSSSLGEEEEQDPIDDC